MIGSGEVQLSSREALSDPTRFVYAGIAFDVEAAPGLSFRLDPTHAVCIAGFEEAPVLASVRVAVVGAPELRGDPNDRSIRVDWRRSSAEIRARRLRAELRELAPGCFVASAVVAPEPSGFVSMTSSLAAVILDRAGGLVVHASGVELDGGVVLFIGPSGAGKTTAANLCSGASAYAADRAAIFPTPAGWHAAPMGGGSEPVRLPSSSRRVLPLRGILRVEQAREPQLVRCAPSAAVAALRESTQTSGHSVDGELQLLDRLAHLAQEVPVGIARTVLAHPLVDDLRDWTTGGSS